MNTTGIQNYLSNVFRPIVSYDTGTSNFTPKLEMSNIDTYSGNIVSVFRADVGSPISNVYVGSNAGNSIVDPRACRNVSAFGYGTGSNISNCSNSVYIGNRAGADSINNQSVIALGYEAGLGGTGVSNIFIGTGTKSTLGSNNIFIGNGIDLSSVSNTLRIGTPIAANLSTNWVGLTGLTTPLDVGNKLDASGNVRIQGQLGLNITPGTRTLDVNGNFRAQDASLNALDFSNGFTRSTGGYASVIGTVLVSNAANTEIGTNLLKKGTVLISVGSGSANYDGRMSLVLNPTTPTVINIASSNSTTTSVNFAANKINISNTTGGDLTYSYNITYFPLP